MTSKAKTVIATGVSSGLGFEVIKILLQSLTPYNIILGTLDVAATKEAFSFLNFDTKNHALTVLPLDLADVRNVRPFAQQTLAKLGQTGIDYLFLSAAVIKSATQSVPNRSDWCESLVVNHIAQHYLVHLLRGKLVDSKSRIVMVSSGVVQNVSDTSKLVHTLKTGSSANFFDIYAASKFIQLLSAHWWRRQLEGLCDVVAVSPGMIPGTDLGRHINFTIDPNLPDARPIESGARSILEAFHRTDFPEDKDRIFLTSWGDWWEVEDIAASVDQDLQDVWAFSQEQIEKEAGIL